jgi:hypothetical protein
MEEKLITQAHINTCRTQSEREEKLTNKVEKHHVASFLPIPSCSFVQFQ